MLYLIAAPQAPVVELDEMKQHLNAVDFDDDDDLIQAIERAAVERLEQRTGRSFMERTYELRLDCFPDCRFIRLPKPPLIAVESIVYMDVDGVEQTFDGDLYHVTGVGSHRGQVQLKANQVWPSTATDWPDAVTIRFRAGYLEAGESPPVASVPEPIKQAVKLLSGHLYANRESVVIGQTAIELPQSVEWLLQDYVTYGSSE